jgi:L-lactate dehydrogenase complex protein LldG
MSTAREKILARIQHALPKSGSDIEADYAGIQREYPSSGTLDLTDKLALLEERLRDYNTAVVRSTTAELPQTIAAILRTHNKQTLVIPAGLPRHWLPEQISFTIDEGLTYEQLNQSEGVLTTCTLAIARTGTIVLRHSEREGRRALTLIPDYHLCIVFADQIVETVVEGIRAIGQFATSPLTTISGPSATSDIEMTRIKGVHGPRVLEVILVTG